MGGRGGTEATAGEENRGAGGVGRGRERRRWERKGTEGGGEKERRWAGREAPRWQPGREIEGVLGEGVAVLVEEGEEGDWRQRGKGARGVVATRDGASEKMG